MRAGARALPPAGGAARDGWVVASSCPRCGAPLDFAEGSNAVRCGHCACVLLVTGRRRVLSYVVRARVAPAEAHKVAAFANAASAPVSRARTSAPRLVFVPYYRLCAEEVSWRRERAARSSEPTDMQSGDLGDQMVRIVLGRVRAREAEHAVTLASRAVERSFLARDAGGLAAWSLGVRTGVLRLELFERAALTEQGTVLRPTLAAETALARALEPLAEVETVHREVLRTVLSLVYFPVWTISTGADAAAPVTVVDGVTGSIIARDADPAPFADHAAEGAGTDRVLGFRPLCCPNCGWDLPVRPADVVFHCVKCERTWELAGEELERIPSDVVAHLVSAPARGRAGPSGEVPHLPVWQVSGRVSVDGPPPRAALPGRLFAPAFRWRALKSLCDLGARLAGGAPEGPELEPVKAMPLVGCSLDREDALTMARLVALRLLLDDANVRDRAVQGKAAPAVTIEDAETRLVWLPFAGDAYSVRDPFTGYALPRRAVEELMNSVFS